MTWFWALHAPFIKKIYLRAVIIYFPNRHIVKSMTLKKDCVPQANYFWVEAKNLSAPGRKNWNPSPSGKETPPPFKFFTLFTCDYVWNQGNCPKWLDRSKGITFQIIKGYYIFRYEIGSANSQFLMYQIYWTFRAAGCILFTVYTVYRLLLIMVWKRVIEINEELCIRIIKLSTYGICVTGSVYMIPGHR